MPKAKVYNQKGETVNEVSLADSVFSLPVNNGLIHQAALAQMGNERQVLAHTKGRAEVRGGGKKPWKQKGTGRARAGSRRSPVWVGGGVVFGPLKNRNFSKKINKKMKQKALSMVLSDRLANNGLVILDTMEIKEFKTKSFAAMVKNLESKVFLRDEKKKKRNVLFINEVKDDKFKYSGRNLAGVSLLNLENINIVDLLRHQNIVLTVKGVQKIEETYKK